MGPLPRERVTQAPPFGPLGYTRVDYMGPILIRSGLEASRFHPQRCVIRKLQLTLIDDDEQDPYYRITPELASQREARTALSKTEKMTKKFWTIWKQDYLLELRDRHQLFKKGQETNRDPKIGNVVLFDEDSQQSRGQWPLAIITDLKQRWKDKKRHPSKQFRQGDTKTVQSHCSARNTLIC
ncbi:hypothetical protein OESDEN_00929 [Oesophagostomum dentatum]|uniref:DUF5641 domain-containing protein n=1 Tax=Oesophagostomum dentatum TaxID=61180 RepID=A0A0B1TTB5_OESDE|nr:hypothetical protein OESDEN_00929 [Oesophagostomum dentatum]